MGKDYEYFAFLSNERAKEYTENSGFNTFTANMPGQFAITPRDRITVKFIDNDLDRREPIRLSLNQYLTNSKITLDVYTQVVNSHKRAAQSKVVQMIVPGVGTNVGTHQKQARTGTQAS